MIALRKCFVALFLGMCFQSMLFAETVGIFSDNTVEQIQFAAGDVKTALEAKGFTVEQLALSSLSTGYANRKVVIALSSNSAVTTILTSQGGTAPTGLGQQAYALRTTTQGQTSYWALGGDVSGAMYGALQIAENISFKGFTGNYNTQESPFLLYRGMKLNFPLDKRLPTYVGGWSSRSARRAISNVWDSTFWKQLIDQQARQRYNLLSVWVHHPFPALVKVPGYEKACLPSIQLYDGTVKAELTHEVRVAFWRRIMQYAHSRGMQFYFFNWNVYVDYASTQYPTITRSQTNAVTKDYSYKSMQALIATYPELDGFGISTGDGMSGSQEEKTAWSWESWGKAAMDYLVANPQRKFTIIHRSLGTNPDLVNVEYKPYQDLPNGTVDFSVKYAMAHMYSTPTPRWTTDIGPVLKQNWKTYLTIRNDDYFYLNWGDPQFVRDFMAGIPDKAAVHGMYIGSDGYNPTRTYFYKNNFSSLNGQLEVQRRWYMEMLWARIAYNPQISEDVFKNMLAVRYPSLPSDNLFKAWSLASRPLPKVTELIMADWELDYHWWPEACWSDPGRCTGFRLIDGNDGFDGTDVARGSNLCNIATSATNGCGTKKSSYTVANEMQANADTALALIRNMSSGGNLDLDVAINNVKQLACLSEYYAYKIRGATYKKAGNTTSAKEAMGKAYCWWMAYTRLMDPMYEGDSTRNVEIYPDWKFGDAAVAKEFTDLGGNIGTLDCMVGIDEKPMLPKPRTVTVPHVSHVSASGLAFTLPANGECSISLFSSTGKLVFRSRAIAGKLGANNIRFNKKIGQGMYLVKVTAGNSSLIEKKALSN